MSGIYIPGMEMPTEGYIDVRIKCNGTAAHSTGEPPYFRAYEALHVPDHGDLIDRDALPENRMVFNGVRFINERFIKEAPVVIPADKERKG